MGTITRYRREMTRRKSNHRAVLRGDTRDLPTWGVALLAFVLLASQTRTARCAAPVETKPDGVERQLRERDQADRRAFDELANWCRGQSLAKEAGDVAEWLVVRDAESFVVFNPPEQSAAADSSAWWARFVTLRRERAGALFKMARQAAAERRKALAYELLWATLREDGDHAEARRILGFERAESRWLWPYVAKQLRAGRVWHERYGWIGRDDVARYDAGERRNGDRWTTAEQDTKRHADIRAGWQVETEHFVVTTNHSLAEGARLAGDLERLHRAWRQVFVDYWLTDSEFDRMFGLGKPATGTTKGTLEKATAKYRVVYYRDREGYVRALTPSQPRVAMSLGVYVENGKAAHFFAGPEQHPATVFHEATHQLFKESRSTVKLPGRQHGAWLVEAAACYMESLERRGGVDTLGRRDAGRFPAAAEKIEENFYVPLAELAAMSSDELQRHGEIAKVYSQSAGLMAFLLHADGGRYRTAVTRTLDALYQGKATSRTLSEHCGASYEQLDREYHAFVKAVRKG